MTDDEQDALDDVEVPQMAVKALDEAHRRAVASGRPVLVIVDGKLIEIRGSTRTVLGEGPRRHKVSCRVKRASS